MSSVGSMAGDGGLESTGSEYIFAMSLAIPLSLPSSVPPFYHSFLCSLGNIF